MSGPNHIIDNFAMIVDDGIILDSGKWSDIRNSCPSEITDLGDVTLTPGLINAHTHMGLSHLEGLTVQGQGFTGWMKSLVKAPLKAFDGSSLINKGQEIYSQGTAYCADISTTDTLKVAQALEETGLGFTSFCENMGQNIPKPGRRVFPEYESSQGRIAGAGHALYSTNAEMLKAVKSADQNAGLPFSIHLAEHEEEDMVLSGQESEFSRMLAEAGLLSSFSGKYRPVEYADELGLLDSKTIAVHCVRLNEDDIDIVRSSGATVCFCPRSNLYIGEGRAPWEKVIGSGINTCLGTDSIASNYDLNLWNELQYLLENIKISISPEAALAMVTVNPALVLGIDSFYGTLKPGAKAVYTIMPRVIEELLF